MTRLISPQRSGIRSACLLASQRVGLDLALSPDLHPTQVLRFDVVEVRPVSLRDIRLAERERDRDARQLQQQASPAAS